MNKPSDEKTYVTVKEACFLLGCGRTKVYTYYLKNDLLHVAKKVGNRTLFLKKDVDELVRLEDQQEAREEIQKPLNILSPSDENHPNTIGLEELSYHNPEQGSSLTPNADSLNSHLKMYRPASMNSQNPDTLVTDYISELKSKIHELEQLVSQKDELLHRLQDKLINSIPKLEYTQKLEQLEDHRKKIESELEMINQQFEQSEQTVKELESNAEILKEKHSQEELRGSRLQHKLTQSLEIALQFQETSKAQGAELAKITAIQKELLQTREELETCGLFDFSIKRKLREQIRSLEGKLKLLVYS